jgi:HAD superfamily hydrolase (TIGR01509 family)
MAQVSFSSKLPRSPAAVVFDMDGLLFDTEALYQRAIALAAAEGGHDLTSTSSLMIGRPIVQSRGILLDTYGPTFPVDEFFTVMFQHFDRIAATDLVLKPGVVELLEALDQLKLPRAIATSSAHHRVQAHLLAHSLGTRFHVIVGHGDYAASKPAPDPFRVAAERLGVEPRFCLALEDSPNGVRSACTAGMMTVMVPDLIEPTDEIQALCNFVASDLHEVRRMILNSRG